MKENTLSSKEEVLNNVHQLTLNEIARVGAQKMLKIALEAEVQAFIEQVNTGDKAPDIVRNGYHKERAITIGTGQINVKVPRTRSRSKSGNSFASSILPKYMRRCPKIDEAIPLMYLKGISTNNMFSALEKLLGNEVSGLSATNVSRMKTIWKSEYDAWKKRDLSLSRYCYIWVDGIYTNVRFSDNRLCNLIVIGATKDGYKELVAVESGYRESKESWCSLLRDLRSRGMDAPLCAIGDGALGFWAALTEIYPETQMQRCWVHKTLNVLDKLPKSQHEKAREMLKEIYMAATKKSAETAFKAFISRYGSKYEKAVECLKKDKEHLLTFFNYPADHWRHIRTTNPIESTFATVRLRSKSTRGHGTEETTFMMIFKLIEMATKRWHRMWGYNLIPLLFDGVKFVDGEEEKQAA